MSKKHNTKDAKTPNSAPAAKQSPQPSDEPVEKATGAVENAGEGKGPTGQLDGHLAMLPGAVEHFAPLIVAGEGSVEQALGLIMTELTSLDEASTKQTLEDRVLVLMEEAEAKKRAADAALAQDKVDATDKVIVNVPKAFKLTLNNGVCVDYPMGAYGMQRTHAEHWYAKANGVTLVEM